MWTKARITGYLVTFFAGVSLILVVLGLADYDPSTRMIDLHPISIDWLAALIAGPIAAGLAALAAGLGWGKKE